MSLDALAFWAKAEREGDCLIWRRSLRRNGYGQVMVARPRRNRTAHTVAYELAIGPIPPGYEVDHACRRRACIEPAHLRLATHKQNAENRDNHPHTRSGIRGVHWVRARGKWKAQVTHNYRTINLGYFDDVSDAERAAVSARALYFTHAN